MSQSPATRPSLLLRLRDPADQDAWKRFVELYAPIIYWFFRKRGVQNADAEDLTQDVLQVVAQRAESFAPTGKQGAFRGWLYGIAQNKLRHHRARRRRTAQGSGDTATLELMAAVPTAEDDAAAWEREHERRLFLWASEQVRTRVDPSTWQAFWQTSVDGRSAEQVAQSLGMSVGAVYVAKSRVTARLKAIIQEIEAD